MRPQNHPAKECTEMPNANGVRIDRRRVLKSSLALLAGGAVGTLAEAEPEIKNVNTASSPSSLKITDMRYAVVVKPGPSPCVLIRIDTNQGVYGLGEVRDIAGPQYAMVLKSRIVGENPLRIDYLFQKIAQFGGNARQAGGVCAVEMALWDIAGKVYNIPVYQMLGGKWRDEIRIYADTTESMDPQEYGRRAKERKAMGLTWMKMDLGINVLEGIPGTVMQPAGMDKWELRNQPHPFIATEVTDKGVERLCEYVAAVRENIGYDMPLSMDHLGHVGVKSAIKLGKAYEKFNLEWMEDVIPWYYTDLLKEITQESPTPTLTGKTSTSSKISRRSAESTRSTRFILTSQPQAESCRRTASAIWLSAMAFRWQCTSREPPSAAWPTSIARRQRGISSHLRIIRWTCPSGRSW
jgi:L-alanine-DL-glutamate epimerase-like enolase superfamily enzyme